MIISSEVCAMFLAQDDDLAQQYIVADFFASLKPCCLLHYSI